MVSHGVSKKSKGWRNEDKIDEIRDWTQAHALKMGSGHTALCLSDLKWTRDGLFLNPDHYHLWNMRKRIFSKIVLKKDNDDDVEEEVRAKELFGEELKLIVKCIQAHPKSYYVWYHRVWLLKNVPAFWIDWKHEMGLIEMMLNLDTRNFHCWDYRRFVVRMMEEETVNSSIMTEFDFTTAKIQQNFSNYSAWHYRSKLLMDQINASSVAPVDEIIKKEFKLIQNAVYTEPRDQSAWMYHNWLIGQGYTLLADEQTRSAILAQDEASISDLYELEPEVKWPLLAMISLKNPDDPKKSDHLKKLLDLDPLRAGYYNFLLSK